MTVAALIATISLLTLGFTLLAALLKEHNDEHL